MEVFETIWGDITMAGVGLATVVVIVRNVGEARAQAGSFWDMVFNRRLMREEQVKKGIEFTKTVEKLQEDVQALANRDIDSERILMMLLKQKLRERCLIILDRGVEFSDEQEEINNMFYMYEQHGWNGSTKSLVERVRQIDVIERENYDKWKERKRRDGD